MIPPSPRVQPFFEPVTSTWQYIISDPTSKRAAIIDPVLDYDPSINKLSTSSATKLLDAVRTANLTVDWLLETHVHADHLTAAAFLRSSLIKSQPTAPPRTGIGAGIRPVQRRWAARYGVPSAECDAAFDHVFADGETFAIGELAVEVLHLPGHTPDHVGYKVGEGDVFVGDTIFNPDVGSARADFPGGSATDLWSSVGRLLSLNEECRVWVGHDYPPAERQAQRQEEGDGSRDGESGLERPYATVGEQRERNKHVKEGTAREEFVKWRMERDASLAEPRLIHQALQWNVRGGRLPAA